MTSQSTDNRKFGILYVDDEEQSLKYFRRGFEKEYTIHSAANVDQALAILEQHAGSIAVVISDQRMPGRSGVEMLTEIRKRWPSIVRILITAFTDLESAVAAVNSGAVFKYITKPADFALLREVLSNAMTVYGETIHRDALAETLKQLEAQREATQLAEAAKEQLHKRLIVASREAGRAEVATGILHNVGNVLNSMNVSLSVVNNTLRESRIANLFKCLDMLSEHSTDLQKYLTEDERGQRLPGYLVKLGPVLRDEKTAMEEAVSVLVRSIEHLTQVVRLQQSHAKQPMLRELVDPSVVIEQALTINKLELEKRGIDVVREHSAVPPLMLDQHRVLQILINLISNAVQAASHNPQGMRQVTVRITNSPTCSPCKCCFEVTDNGVGIAPENLFKIFSYGFTTKTDGHGFGLHSSANAAKEMGGELAVRSDGLGSGATFTLELPICEDQRSESLTIEPVKVPA